MSNRICCLLRSFTARSRRPTSKLPSPIAMRSPIASTRCVEAIRVVRSGVTKPLKIMRPASRSSVASATSTSPMAGLSASTEGWRGPRGHHFEIIGRGAGALRHAGDLRRLHGQPLALRGGDDPVAQHAAAVAAQGADQDGDGFHALGIARSGAQPPARSDHERAGGSRPAERSRHRSDHRRRKRHFRRSHQVAFCTMSAL